MLGSHRIAVALVLFAGALDNGARADEPHEPVVLVYRAPAACPGERAFLEEVRQRTVRLREPHAGEPFRQFTVEISTAKRARGRLRIRDADGGESQRAVEGENCAEVASALALMVAIAVDPTVSMRPLAPPPAPPAPPPAVVPVPRVTPPSSRAPIAPRAKRRAWTAALAAQGVLATGAAPGAFWGAGIATTWTAPLDRDPSLRMDLAYLAGAGEPTAGAGRAHFSRTTAGLEGCAMRLRLGPASVFPCARVEVGALRAEGEDIARATREVRPWVAVGPSVRARWTFWPRAGAFVELGAAAMVPVTRDRFFFEPDATIYRAAPVGMELQSSLGTEL